MSDDSGGRCIGCEVNGVFATPAEARGADLEVRGREGRSRGSKGLEEGEDAGFGDRGTISNEPGKSNGCGFEDVEGFVENGGEPGGGLCNLVLHEVDDGEGQ